jgi:hypothetical protein
MVDDLARIINHRHHRKIYRRKTCDISRYLQAFVPLKVHGLGQLRDLSQTQSRYVCMRRTTMPILAVLTNDQGDIVGTAQTEIQGRGTDVPGRVSLVARPGQQVMEIAVDEEVLNLDPSALHEFIKAKYLHPAAESVTSGSQSMPQKDHSSADESCEKPIAPSEDRDLVITPAGPRPRDSVHPVRPNEAVRRDPNGTYTVVPKNGDPKSGTPKSGRGPRQSQS